MFLIISLAVFLTIGCEMGGEEKVLQVEKDPSTFLDTAIINDFDIREWSIIVKSTGVDWEYVSVTYDMLSPLDVAKLNKVGTHELTFTYQGQSFVHTITISEPTEESSKKKIAQAMRDDLIPNVASTNFYLPKIDSSVEITWSVDSPYIELKGYKAIITRPSISEGDREVTLHAVFALYSYTLERDYKVIVPATGMEELYDYLDEIVFAIQPPTSITTDLDLAFAFEDVTITWSSSNTKIILIDNEAKNVSVSSVIDETNVMLKASINHLGSVYENYASYSIKVVPTTQIKIAPAPTNLKVENHLLSWTKSADVNKYNIYVNGQLKAATNANSILLTSIIKSAGNYTVGVQAVASGLFNTDSDIITTSYTGVDSIGYVGDYYNGTNLTLSGANLKAALRTLISKNKHATTYEELKTYIPKSDRSLTDSSKVVLIYSRIEVKGAWVSGGVYWNREHVWPQSLGWFTTSGAGSDLHHLRPEDPSLNTTRSNKPFGEVSNGTRAKVSSTNGGVLTDCYYTAGYFEPADSAKGDVARILFYLLTRYTEADSYRIASVAQSMDMLLRWNDLDPVDDWEMQRNDVAQDYQGNRNPFIDYPNLAREIWG